MKITRKYNVFLISITLIFFSLLFSSTQAKDISSTPEKKDKIINFDKITPGKNVPDEINVIIEIPARGEPVKYEVDKESGALFVDRFMTTAMYYPANYGYIPHTLSEDGDPVDVLVLTEVPLLSGSVIRARPIGMLQMEDESGIDAKILAVPIDKISASHRNIRTHLDLPDHILATIEHFFAHYKDLEEGKWVKIKGWQNIDAAKKEIVSSMNRKRREETKDY